ncbi:pyridoxamine 5'-phosphate oxidase family protein [Maribacter chungangensis]|uniref:Pyridoxamine 5'-phosphate oxidase family protein n=1 Tax=Maribacter chungangensis TaxID=1069117 RepID=A0ABW3B545_9FLAO
MTQQFLEEAKQELKHSLVKKGHPFRYFTLATVGLDPMARLRTVVLRQITEDFKLIFYTDRRSKKMTHITENPKVSCLFYHPKQLLQLKIEGKARVVNDEKILKKYWHGIQPNSRKDYLSEQTPGSTLNNPDELQYLNDDNHFSMVEIEPFKIEYLKLKRPNHLRVRFSKSNNDWDGEFLVP